MAESHFRIWFPTKFLLNKKCTLTIIMNEIHNYYIKYINLFLVLTDLHTYTLAIIEIVHFNLSV